MTESVELGTLFSIGKDSICFLDFLELVFGVIFLTTVWVVLSCKTAKRILEVG